MAGFMEFIRKQGVIGLAVGFILGGAVSKVVSSLVADIINPLIGLLLGGQRNLSAYSIHVGAASINVGNFLSMVLDFAVIAFVVYFVFKWLKLDRVDLKK